MLCVYLKKFVLKHEVIKSVTVLQPMIPEIHPCYLLDVKYTIICISYMQCHTSLSLFLVLIYSLGVDSQALCRGKPHLHFCQNCSSYPTYNKFSMTVIYCSSHNKCSHKMRKLNTNTFCKIHSSRTGLWFKMEVSQKQA
jgi:hypothetical protein